MRMLGPIHSKGRLLCLVAPSGLEEKRVARAGQGS